MNLYICSLAARIKAVLKVKITLFARHAASNEKQFDILLFVTDDIRNLNTSSRPEPDSQYGCSASCEDLHKESTEGDYRKCVHAIN